jgi:hypothetical protein
MNRILLILILFSLITCKNGLNNSVEEEFIPGYFYYGNNNQIPIFMSSKIISVKFKSEVSSSEAQLLANQFGLSIYKDLYSDNIFWPNLLDLDYIVMILPESGNLNDYITKYPRTNNNSFSNHKEIKFCMPSYSHDESGSIGSRLFLGNEFIANSDRDSSVIAAFCKIYSVEIISNGQFGNYLLDITDESPFGTLECANKFYEDSLFIWAHPNFLAIIEPE